MGKGTQNPGPSTQVSQGLLSDENALVSIAGQQEQNAQQLYSLTEPGLQVAENQYQALASGDPAAIMRAIAPTAAAASQATAGAKSNILANDPAGGEKNLALEQTDVNRGAQISQAASGATLAAPNALGQLAGQGVGESISAGGAATSALGAGSSSLSSLGGLQIRGQEIQAQEKGAQLGAFGSLAGVGGELGSAAILSGGAGGGGAGGGAAAAAPLAAAACYLTSACTESLGLPDNCNELETLRWFRQNYVGQLPDGGDFLCEYRTTAPRIVAGIQRLGSGARQVFERIYRELVIPSVTLIQYGHNGDAFELYRNYARRLQSEFIN